MLNPLNSKHRQRLASSMEQTSQELLRFNRMRRSTVNAYLGINALSGQEGFFGRSKRTRNSLPKGNILQQAGIGFQIMLAYGEPRFTVRSRVPDHEGLARDLRAAINRMSTLLNLGEIARNVAADSFFGYGVYKCGVGRMPVSAQKVTGLEIGPSVWRVSQDNFGYDLLADSWDNVSFAYDLYPVAVEDAQRDYPEHADRLQALTETDRLDANRVFTRSSRFSSAEERIWLVDVYFPAIGAVATWPVRNSSFGEVENEPLLVREYNGHWSGIYQVLNHLYAPDELIPVAQAESTKALHYLHQDLMDKLSNQALNAKVNPTYFGGGGSDRDMRRLWDAKDRHPVSITNPNNFGSFVVPGPSQDQAAFLAAVDNFATKFNPSLDAPARAPTARQGELERETTNVFIAESRRKATRALQQIGYKLGHLLMANNELVLPSSEALRTGSDISVDRTWRPGIRPAQIDDFDLDIDPYSLPLRTPSQRLQMLLTLSAEAAKLLQLKAMGAPINIEAAFESLAEFGGEPDFKKWFEETDPLYMAQRAGGGGQISNQRTGVGHYVRENVSEKTNAGALQQNLTQGMSANSTSPRYE